MYITKIKLNKNLRDVTNPINIHSNIELGLKRSENKNVPSGRILWRLEDHGIETHLLVVTPAEPDFKHINGESITKEYSKLIESVEEGKQYLFKVKANTVRCSKGVDGSMTSRGKVMGITDYIKQKEWFIEKSKSYGFKVDNSSFDIITAEQEVFIKRTGEKVTIMTADIEGVLTISDVNIFRNTLTHGFGRAKAYGCGLITIMRA